MAGQQVVTIAEAAVSKRGRRDKAIMDATRADVTSEQRSLAMRWMIGVVDETEGRCGSRDRRFSAADVRSSTDLLWNNVHTTIGRENREENHGDEIWRYVGKLTDAQKSMLDDRFKWKAREMDKRREGKPGEARAALRRSVRDNGSKLQRRGAQELIQTTLDQLVDDEAVYYKVAGECPKGRVYGLGSLGRKKRRYADADASTSQVLAQRGMGGMGNFMILRYGIDFVSVPLQN
ncbi:hypothetical protein Scep_028568 [Stephania cephalantha]|uniref:Uncharacterized protein n=1 Tax=Stephania cephalantha TaxID=152367 RepID=A0AAP0EA67_9MAGN